MTLEELGLAGVVAMLFLEVVKFVYRRYVIKQPEYDFPPLFYYLALPTLSVFATPFLAWLGLEGYAYPESILALVKQAVVVFITMAGAYWFGLKKLKTYTQLYFYDRTG